MAGWISIVVNSCFPQIQFGKNSIFLLLLLYSFLVDQSTSGVLVSVRRFMGVQIFFGRSIKKWSVGQYWGRGRTAVVVLLKFNLSIFTSICKFFNIYNHVQLFLVDQSTSGVLVNVRGGEELLGGGVTQIQFRPNFFWSKFICPICFGGSINKWSVGQC